MILYFDAQVKMIRLRTKCFHYSDPQHGWKLQQFVPLRLTVPFNFKHKSVYRTFEKRTFIYKESKLVTCRRPTYRPRWTWTRWAAWWWSPWWWSCRSHRSSRTCSNQKLIFASTGAGAVEAKIKWWSFASVQRLRSQGRFFVILIITVWSVFNVN